MKVLKEAFLLDWTGFFRWTWCSILLIYYPWWHTFMDTRFCNFHRSCSYLKKVDILKDPFNQVQYSGSRLVDNKLNEVKYLKYSENWSKSNEFFIGQKNEPVWANCRNLKTLNIKLRSQWVSAAKYPPWWVSKDKRQLQWSRVNDRMPPAWRNLWNLAGFVALGDSFDIKGIQKYSVD